VNALDIAVTDLTAAIKFYRRLGLEFVRTSIGQTTTPDATCPGCT
jgi:catechol 2,3-dioxygenase-like lactoylglutathione lyase family enzyme